MNMQVESRKFSIHPAIIKSLINEQAGNLAKALSELVTNSIDAGATSVDIVGAKNGEVTLTDDGRGFQSREEILSVFEMFGLPHNEGDAVHGRFRVGRGQIMAYGRVSWRSGYFEMLVDLEGVEDDFGYHLIEHEEEQPGCVVTLTPNPDLVVPDTYVYGPILEGKPIGRLKTNYVTVEDVAGSIRYVSVPVYIEGECVSTPAGSCKWTEEDACAYYHYDRNARSLELYSQGVWVCSLLTTHFGLTGCIVSKHPLKLNMARNTIIRDCGVWDSIRDAMRAYWQKQVARYSDIKDDEVPALLRQILRGDVTKDERGVLLNSKFIVDVFGKKQSLGSVLNAARFTFYDSRYPMIAEQVERQQLAKVIMPSTLKDAGLKANEDSAASLMGQIVRVFCQDDRLEWSRMQNATFVPFSHYVDLLDSNHEEVREKDLTQEEKLVLQVARQLNFMMYHLAGGPRTGVRKINVGRSDTANAWTDGISTITLRRGLLRGVRGKHFESGISRLCSIIIHEYCHGDSSTEQHHHTLEFYEAFHDAIMKPAFGELVNSFFRRYLTGLAKHGIRPSGEHNSFIKRIAELEPQLNKKSVHAG